jgi:hypothetical protein
VLEQILGHFDHFAQADDFGSASDLEKIFEDEMPPGTRTIGVTGQRKWIFPSRLGVHATMNISF